MAEYNLGTHVEDIVNFFEYPLPSPPIYSLAKWPSKEDTNVAHLSHGNYSEWINNSTVSLVLFYTPTSQICTFGARDLEALGKIWPNKMGAVKCFGKNKALCQKEGVKGYPTYILYQDSKPIETIEGRVNQDSLIRLVTRYF